MTKISIVIPARNEEDNLPILIPELKSILSDWCLTNVNDCYELVIVNDGSTDNTRQIIDSFDHSINSDIIPVHRTSNHGFGNAIKDGIKKSTGDIVILVMADLSDNISDIPKMISKIEKDNWDIVYGDRFTHGDRTIGYPILKKISNQLFNRSVRLLFGVTTSDTTNAFKAYRKEVLDNIEIKSEGFDLCVELPLKAHILGYKSTTVQTVWTNRKNGIAKLKLSENTTKYGFELLSLFFMGLKTSMGDLFGMVGKNSKYKLIGMLLVGILILMGLSGISGTEDVYNTLKGVSLIYLPVIFGLLFISSLVRMYRWKLILRSAGHDLSSSVVYKSMWMGFLVNVFVPARAGDIMRGFALKITKGTPMGIGLSTMVVERIMDMVTMSVVLGIGLLSFSNTTMVWLSLSSFGVAGVLMFGLGVVYWHDNVLLRLLDGRLKWVEGFMGSVKEGIKEITSHPSTMVVAMSLSLPLWLLEVGALWLASKSVGYDLSYSASMVTGIASFLSQTVPLTIGGIGVFEGTMVGVLNMFGVPLYVGMAMSLVDHFNRILFCLIVGGISMVHLAFMSRPYFREMKK